MWIGFISQNRMRKRRKPIGRDDVWHFPNAELKNEPKKIYILRCRIVSALIKSTGPKQKIDRTIFIWKWGFIIILSHFVHEICAEWTGNSNIILCMKCRICIVFGGNINADFQLFRCTLNCQYNTITNIRFVLVCWQQHFIRWEFPILP